jgi:hypothetical protein
MANPTSCLTLGLASTSECSQVMALYCSTSDDQGLTYTEKWQGDELTSPCRRFVALNLGNQRQYVPVVDAYVRRYLLTERRAISYPAQGSQLYDPAIADVIAVCSAYPGSCDNVLQNVCSGFTSQELGGNPSEASLCGCFLSSAEFDKEGGAFGVPRECSSTCLLQSAVKPRDLTDQTSFLRCKQSICIIDDVTINILGKSTAGNISFNQACSSCGNGGSCVCSISNVSITAVESTIKDTSFLQQCGGIQNLRCFKKDINGIPRSVPCTNLDPATTNPTTTTSLTSSRLRTILIISIIVIVVIIIIVIVVLLLRRNQPSVYRPASATVINTPPLAYYPSGYSGSALAQAPLL